MTIEKIKNNIDSKLGDNVKIIYNGSRNKKEEYHESKNDEALSTIYSIMLPSCILFMQRRS